MKKMYFELKPSDFKIYNKVDRDGKLEFVSPKDFELEDNFFNKMIFVSKKRKIKGRFSAKEFVTGTKFTFKVIPTKDKDKIVMYNNRLNLKTKADLTVDDVHIKNSKATGFFNAMKENDNFKKSYVLSVLDFFANARIKKKEYLKDIEGPSKNTLKEYRTLSKTL